MGQQQLLLIVLGVIIVGIAVVVGINMFTASSASANQDAVISDLTNLAAMAQQFYRKPAALGGGGNTFTGFVIPPGLLKTSNMSAVVVPTVSAQSVTFLGKGTDDGDGDGTVIAVTMVVSPTAIASTTVAD